jgi:nitrogen-specific signal transduction histidine kinase
MASSKGLLASYYIDPSIAPLLLVDRTRLSQILLNLLSNGQPRFLDSTQIEGRMDRNWADPF